MSDKEFWQAVYIAAIRAGLTSDTAKMRAALAVDTMRNLALWFERPVHE